jgi:hypothetical protein
MNKARALSTLVSVYTAVWFALDGCWFFQWHVATIVLSVLLVVSAFASVFFMRRTRHAILLSAAEFSWILFNVFWIRFDLGGVQWCRPFALALFMSGAVWLVVAFTLRTFSKVQQPFDNFIFRRLKL